MRNNALFPYIDRLLGFESLVFERPVRRSPENLAMIALANVKVKDSFLISNVESVITLASKNTINITTGDVTETITPDNYKASTLFLFFLNEITENINKRIDVIGDVIERDPAVYRARVGGWVLNDELVRMTGNVRYTFEAEAAITGISAKNKELAPTPLLKVLKKDDQEEFDF